MAGNESEADVTNGPRDAGTGGPDRTLTLKLWVVLFVAYVVLLGGTGYIAFFQPAFNPATEIDEMIEARIEQESTREFTLEALREEGIAFKQRRELAVQSFNIVLGAALGFLSAVASQAILRR
jgi:hypothetical protein